MKSSILTTGWGPHKHINNEEAPCQVDCSEIPLYTAHQQHHQYFYALHSTMYFHAKLIFCFFNPIFSTVPISLQIWPAAEVPNRTPELSQTWCHSAAMAAAAQPGFLRLLVRDVGFECSAWLPSGKSPRMAWPSERPTKMHGLTSCSDLGCQCWRCETAAGEPSVDSGAIAGGWLYHTWEQLSSEASGWLEGPPCRKRIQFPCGIMGTSLYRCPYYVILMACSVVEYWMHRNTRQKYKS